MATRVLKRRLVNPARKKKSRKLTAKQIKFFGTKAQKAGLKAARKRKKNASRTSWRKAKKDWGYKGRKVRKSLGNSKTGKRTTGVRKNRAARRARKKNFGEILTVGLNPARPKKKRKTMAKTHSKKSARRRRRSSAHAHRHTRRRVNAAPRRHRNRTRRTRRTNGRRRNPSVRSASGLLVKAGWTVAGAVGTRMLTQLVLQANNAGVMGYGANAVAALALGWGAGKFAGKEAGSMVTLGGFVAIVLRALQDFTPFGASISSAFQGLGDLGIYGATTFFVPLQEAESNPRNPANMQMPGAVSAIAAAAAAKSQTTGIAGLGGGRYAAGGGRYAM